MNGGKTSPIGCCYMTTRSVGQRGGLWETGNPLPERVYHDSQSIFLFDKSMLNTLTIARSLSKSGFKREQAEAIANVVADAAEKERGDLATKDFVRSQINTVRGEISDLRGDMNSEIGTVRGEISTVRGEISTVRGEISRLETRLIRWVVGTGIAVGALAGTAVTIVLSFIL